MTALAHIQITRVEAGNGWYATCSRCDWWAIRSIRFEADRVANRHRASHATPNPPDLEEP